MKTSGLLLFIGLFISVSLSAQKPLKTKPDSLILDNSDSLYSRFLKNQLKQRYHFKIDSNFIMPEKKFLPDNRNLAFAPDSTKFVVHDPYGNMPILVPKFRSNMPVMKPDPSIHYFLKIKKF